MPWCLYYRTISYETKLSANFGGYGTLKLDCRIWCLLGASAFYWWTIVSRLYFAINKHQKEKKNIVGLVLRPVIQDISIYLQSYLMKQFSCNISNILTVFFFLSTTFQDPCLLISWSRMMYWSRGWVGVSKWWCSHIAEKPLNSNRSKVLKMIQTYNTHFIFVRNHSTCKQNIHR